MDLAGPRIRTGPVEPGPPVLHWRPQRDVYGRVVRPARIWLTGSPAARPPEAAAAIVPVDAGWLAGLEIGERLRFEDARGKRRALAVVAQADGGVWAESEESVYLLPGTPLRRDRGCRGPRRSSVGDLPPTAQTILLRPGDTVILSRSGAPGRPAVCAADGRVLTPAIVGVSLPSILDDVRVGEPVWFDDGRIGGTIRATSADGAEVTIVHARAGASKLGAEKGINLPDSALRLPSLTDKDLEDLRFMVAHADIVGYSFVRTAADVEALQARLAEASTRELGVILKIETRRAFEQLPALLLCLMRSPAAGVMIARGDLAVECGFERLAELQEQILSLAEASHVPVIWATQVLESLAKDGIPSRAEITDAAMAERAECVMLNKGPHVLEAVRALDDILRRMQAHQQKKHPMLRALGVAERYLRG
jgi:pyruvate kinase